MRRFSPALALSALFLSGIVLAADEKKPAETKKAAAPAVPAVLDYQQQLQKTQEELGKRATHELIKEVKLQGKGPNLSLQTLSVDNSGRVLALVAPPRYFNAPAKNVTSEIHVLDADGKPLGVWSVNFHAHSVNAGPDGTVYVAGDAKVAKFAKDGKQIGEIVELPHIAELLKNKTALREKAEKQLKQQKDSCNRSPGR